MLKRTRNDSGVAVLEFALLTLVWVPLLLGTLFYGAELIRAMQLVQVAKDVGHMYARGVDFSSADNKAMVADLGEALKLQVAGGDAVVILTTVTFISTVECGAVTPCTNKNKWVVMQRSTIGNTGLTKNGTVIRGNYTPNDLPTGDFDSLGRVTGNYALTDSRLQLRNFSLINLPTDTTGFQPGKPAYLVEAYVKSTPVAGFRTNPGLYVQMLF